MDQGNDKNGEGKPQKGWNCVEKEDGKCLSKKRKNRTPYSEASFPLIAKTARSKYLHVIKIKFRAL